MMTMQKNERRESPATVRQINLIHLARLFLLMACLILLWNTGAKVASGAGFPVDQFAGKIKVNTIQVLASPRKEDVIQAARILERVMDGVYIKKVADQYVLLIGSFPDSREGIQAGLSVLDEVRQVYPRSFLRPVCKTPQSDAQNRRRDYRWSDGEQLRNRKFPPLIQDPDPMSEAERYGYGSSPGRRPPGDERRSLYHLRERNIPYGTGHSYHPSDGESTDRDEIRYGDRIPGFYGSRNSVDPEAGDVLRVDSGKSLRETDELPDGYTGRGTEKEKFQHLHYIQPIPVTQNAEPQIDLEEYGYGSAGRQLDEGMQYAPHPSMGRDARYPVRRSYRSYDQGPPDLYENRSYKSATRSYGNKKAVAPESAEERPIYGRPLSRNPENPPEDYFPEADLGKEKEGQATISNSSPSSSPAEMSEADLMVARSLGKRRPESGYGRVDNFAVRGADEYEELGGATGLRQESMKNRERVFKETSSGKRKGDDRYSVIRGDGAAVKPKFSSPIPTPFYSAAASRRPHRNAAGSLTLQESIRIALKQSVVIQSAKEGVVGAQYAKKEAFTNFLPKLNTSYNYTRLNEPPVFRTPETSISLTTYDRRLSMANAFTIPSVDIPMGTKDNYAWALEVKQPLFAGGGILSNYLANRTGEEIARMEEVTAIQDVIQEVMVSYYNVLKAQSLYDVAVKSLERLKAHRDMAANHFKVGMVALNDYLATDVEVANGEQNLVKAENAVEMASAKFNTALRRPLNTPVELVDALEVRPDNRTLEFCINEAMDRRPEIKAYSLKAKQAGHLVDAAKSEYFPTVSFLGHYELSGDTPGVNGAEYSETFASASIPGSRGNVTVHGSQTKDRESWYLMFMLSWNFWEWGKTQYRVGNARSREMQVNYALANIRDQISLDVKNAWLNLRQAEKQISVARKAIDEAEESFLISLERYRESTITTTTVLDAQTRLTKANSDYYNALGDYHIGLAKLERAMGNLSPENRTGQ